MQFQLLRRFAKLARPYWVSEEKRRACGWLVLLFLLLVADTQLNVWFNEQSGEFTSALAARETERFWSSILTFVTLLVVAVPTYSFYYFVRYRLGLEWRRWMTNQLLNRYFADRGFYDLLAKPEIDNPDQRIAEDVNSFTSQSLSFLLLFAGGVFQLVAFGRVLWGISHMLVVFLVLYAIALTATSIGLFGKKMVLLYFNQRRREADFRFGLVRVRENAEAIALYHGENQEQGQIQKIFAHVFSNYANLIGWSLRLNFFQYTNSLLMLILPSVVIAPRVLSGELEVGSIVQATGAFSAILGALTLLIDNLDGLSQFAAGITRLDSFADSLEPDPAATQSTVRVENGQTLELKNVTLRTPSGERTLVQALTIAVAPGQSLMIVGPSGLGKSSLLRLIAGLWRNGEGLVVRPGDDAMLFLPQHAYMATGNLRMQLSYPNLQREVSEEELQAVLEKVNLPDLAEQCKGFDSHYQFEKLLSVGERQRLAIARVLLKQPQYVMLDEATSALDRTNEELVYQKMLESQATLVSVSHHPALVRFHQQVLELKANGEWELHAAKDFRFRDELLGV